MLDTTSMSGEIPKAFRLIQESLAGRGNMTDILRGEAIVHSGPAARWRRLYGGRWGRLFLTDSRLVYRDAGIWLLRQQTIEVVLSRIQSVTPVKAGMLHFARIEITLVDGYGVRYYVDQSDLVPWVDAITRQRRETARLASG